MKTSIAAVVAASLFLVAALFGIGSGNGAPPSQPGSIVLAGSAGASGPGAAVPLTTPTPDGSTATAAPATASGAASGGPAVVAVGRSVQQTNISQLLSPAPSNASSGGAGGANTPDLQALGGITPLPVPTADNQQPTTQNSTPPVTGGRPPITTSPINGPRPGASPTGGALKGILGGVGGLLGLGTSPTPSPVPPTSTATPPVTSTATG